jgi:co-chaperonin GroES (HSP10)
MTGQVLLRIEPPETHSAGGIELPQRRITPEEQQQLNHHPQPPPPFTATVEAIGRWPSLKNGLHLLPPFPVGAKVLVRTGSGQDLQRGIGERLKLVRTEDVLAVIS